jgi:hypothetical protein
MGTNPPSPTRQTSSATFSRHCKLPCQITILSRIHYVFLHRLPLYGYRELRDLPRLISLLAVLEVMATKKSMLTHAGLVGLSQRQRTRPNPCCFCGQELKLEDDDAMDVRPG